MHRRLSHQLLAMFGAVWFILIGIEPAVFGACPAHLTMGAATSHGSQAMATMPMDAAEMHHAAAPGHDAGTPEKHQSHQCTCPGSCCGPSVVAVPSASTPVAVVVTTVWAPSLTSYQYRASWTDFVLPFATAPPQSPPA